LVAVSSPASLLLGRLPSRRAGVQLPLQVVVALIAAAGAGAVAVQGGSWKVPLALFGAAALAAIGMAQPALFAALFLLVRPLLDGINDQHVGALNAAGALGGLVVFVLLGQFVTSARTFRPRGTAAFSVVVALTTALCLPAFLDYASRVHSKPVGEVVRIGAMLAIYVLAGQLFANQKRLTQLFTLVGLTGVIPALLGIKQLIVGVPIQQGLTIARINGPFVGPNPFGMYLALTAIVLIGLPKRALPTWARYSSLAVILIALVGTYSRAGWALFLIAFVMLVWRRNPRLIAVGVGVVLLLIAFVPSIHDRVLPPSNSDSGSVSGGIATPESYTFRLHNWSDLMSVWVDRPLTGYGTQTTIYVNPHRVYDPTGMAAPVGYDAHNSAIKLLIEGGILLLAAWGVLIAIVTGTTRRLSRREWPFRWEARVVFALWVSGIVIGLATDDPLAATAMMYALFALTGGLEGAYRSWQETVTVRPGPGPQA
jgi:O-antigen ligase